MNHATHTPAARNTPPETDIADDRARYYMQIWSEWWQRNDSRLGFPSRVPLLATGGGWDTQAQYDALDNAAAEATDAALQDMTALHRLALQNAYTAAVLRFRRLEITDLLHAAHIDLARRLRTRGFE